MDLDRGTNGPSRRRVVAPDGTTYLDTLCYNFLAGESAKPSPSPVMAVKTDGTFSEATRATSFPNGMALAPVATLFWWVIP